jgi:hypothetical protein
MKRGSETFALKYELVRIRMQLGRLWRGILMLLPLLGGATLHAQHGEQDLPHRDSLRQEGRLSEIMRKGEVEGLFRQFSMFTVNDGPARDYHAMAFGGVLGFSSQRWKGVQFKLTGGYTFDLGGSDLVEPDPVTGLPNRYELALYDMTDPRHRNDLSYLHEFQLNYRSRQGRSHLVFGKQHLNTPFLNPQDSRMHPTLFEGLWARHELEKGTQLEGGWIYRVAPRGTSEWYPVAESMSVYPKGRNLQGEPSAHGEHTRSVGIFAGSIRQKLRPRTDLTLWNVFVENVFNTAMVQLETGQREDRWSLSTMGIVQTPMTRVRPGEEGMAYMPGGEESMAFSARLRHVPGKFRWQLNYSRITAHGRYLMPREWGRDPLYTFLPRERNEGLGDVHATSANLILKDLRPGLRMEAAAGAYWLPDVENARLNKYALPSYAHYVLNMQYQFQDQWKGLAVQLIYLYKMPLYDQQLTAAQAFNRVNMHHGNLILNYAF